MPSPLLLWTTLAVVLAALVLPYSGAAAALFGFVPLSLPLIGSALLIVGGYVLSTEAVKLGCTHLAHVSRQTHEAGLFGTLREPGRGERAGGEIP
jgi:hypothetical protein